jgi:hypothetical protein
MSILQEYSSIRKSIGEEKFQAIEMYLHINGDLYLSDIYYKEGEWNKFDKWYNNSYLKNDFLVNGYNITFNDYWNKWNVCHEEIGFCGEFINIEDAVDYSKNG